MSGIWESMRYKLSYPLMIGSFRNILLENGRAVFEEWPAIYFIGALSNVALVGPLDVWAVSVIFAGTSILAGKSSQSGQRALSWVLLSLAGLYLLAPYNFFGLLNPAGRLILPFIAIGLLTTAPQGLRFWRWAALPAAVGLSISLAGYLGLIALGPAAYRDMPFSPTIKPAGRASVFQFNQGLYANTRFPYFNYRVLVGGKRFAQLEGGDHHGLGFRTGQIIRYKPPR